MNNILTQIIDRTRLDLALEKQRLPEARLREMALALGVPHDFRAALGPAPDGRPRVIAELKRASPSKGLIRGDFGVVSLAAELEEHGAAALSVLTEPRWFQGSPEYLRVVAANAAIPALRKDFIFDPYQILEARAWGASAILLIAAALTDAEFASLHALADQLHLAVLAEVHDHEELKRVLGAGATMVGVNSRDLRSFQTSLDAAAELLAEIPAGCLAVAESGIRTGADLATLGAAGADAFLIGETLMRATHPGVKLDELRDDAMTAHFHPGGHRR